LRKGGGHAKTEKQQIAITMQYVGGRTITNGFERKKVSRCEKDEEKKLPSWVNPARSIKRKEYVCRRVGRS